MRPAVLPSASQYIIASFLLSALHLLQGLTIQSYLFNALCFLNWTGECIERKQVLREQRV